MTPVTSVPTSRRLVAAPSAANVIQPSNWGPSGVPPGADGRAPGLRGTKWSNVNPAANPSPSAVCQMSNSRE